MRALPYALCNFLQGCYADFPGEYGASCLRPHRVLGKVYADVVLYGVMVFLSIQTLEMLELEMFTPRPGSA